MNDRDKTKEQMIEENAALRGQIVALEAQLAQATTDQRQINDSLPVLVATAGADGYYQEVNAAFERILGWSEQESLSRPFLQFIHPEDRAMVLETFGRLKAGEPAVNLLDRNICKDGSYRWINWIAIPVPDRDIVFGIGQDRVMNWLRTPVLDKFGLVEAINDMASQLRSRPDAPEIEYQHHVKFKRLEPTLENILFRIAQEAMTNAYRHSKSARLHVKLTQKGDNVVLEVRDWGIGFIQDQVHENRFGLEGIRERASILGGKLSIKSKPGEGTVVRAKFARIEAVDEG